METEREIMSFLDKIEPEVTPATRFERLKKAVDRLESRRDNAYSSALAYYVNIKQTIKTARGTVRITSEQVLKDLGFIHETKEGASITLPEKIEDCEVVLTINYLENGGSTAYYTAFDNQINKAYVRSL